MATGQPSMVATRPLEMGRVLKIAGALAFTAVLAVFFPAAADASGAMLGGILAFIAAAIGLAAVARVRPLPRRSFRDHARLIGLALSIGSALGIANLLANYGIASLDPSIHIQMSTQFAQFSAWSIVLTDPFLEEIGFRLLLMGGVAWLVSRSTDDRRTVFLIALTVSAVVFAFPHILPGSRPTTGALHATAVVIKSGAAGLVLGSVFWRWGLPYSIACHSTANAIHLVALPVFF